MWIFPAIRYIGGTSWLSNPLLPPRFPFFQTNNLQINGHNYLWPPQLRTTAIKLINRGRLSVSPDCCVIRGAINKAVLLPCDILQMVWQQQLLLLQPLGSIHPHHAGRGWVRHSWRKTHFHQFPLFRFASFWQCVGSRTKFALPCLLCVCPRAIQPWPVTESTAAIKAGAALTKPWGNLNCDRNDRGHSLKKHFRGEGERKDHLI